MPPRSTVRARRARSAAIRSCTDVHSGSITMRYRTYRPGSEELAAEARVTQACVHMDGLRAVPVPDDVRAALERHRDEG